MSPEPRSRKSPKTLRAGLDALSEHLESEQRFRQLLQMMPVAVYVCDTSGMIQSYNNRAVELWGRKPKPGDTAQRYCASLRLYSPDGKFVPQEESKMAEVLRTGVPARDLEVVIERPDGSRLTALVNIAPLRNARGELTGAVNCFQDITERKQSENLLRESESQLRLVIDTIPAMAWILRPDGSLDFINRRWLEYTGLSLEKALADPVGAVHPEGLPGAMKKWSRDFPEGNSHEDEMRLRRADGEYRWFLIRTVPLRDEQGNIVKWYGTNTDIEERKQTEQMLRDSRERLRALSARLQSVREEEAIRIAREIHDDLGQKLTGLRMDLLRAERKIDGLEHSSAVNSLLDAIVNATKLTDGITASVQEIAAGLRPGVLDKLGLATALQYEARRFQERTGIQCEARLPEKEPRVSADVSTALFRILQECLTNVARHAGATKVEVELRLEDDLITMLVRDNGRGLTEGDLVNPRSLGVLGIKERAAMFGGEANFHAPPGGGTLVTVRVPPAGTQAQPGQSL